MNLCCSFLNCCFNSCFNRHGYQVDRMGVNFSGGIPVATNSIPNTPTSSCDEVKQSNSSRERKKMKMTGFATLRRRFMKKRRWSKTCDHGRVIRDFVSNWSHCEVCTLLQEYEALAALKDLTIQAELARPPAATYKQHLCSLYQYKYCTDVDLIFQGVCFPSHRAILSARCSYLRDLLSKYPSYDAQVHVELQSSKLDVHMFSALLRYVYTGDVGPMDDDIDVALLRRLGDHLGIANQLEHDLRYLLETGDYADTILVFSSDGPSDNRRLSANSEFGFRPKLELLCHKSILSARSPFFRNIVQRRNKSGEEHTERALHVQSRIVLDDSVIPKRYCKLLLQAIYLDTVDVSLILRGSGCASVAGTLAEVESNNRTCNVRPTLLEEVMELYQIGRFLELDILAQGAEDLILEYLTIETLPIVLRWGSQPHGSSWAYRQAKLFLCEEFSQIVNSSVLQEIDKSHFIDCLQSDFIQASELDILQAVLNWAESRLFVHDGVNANYRNKAGKKREVNDVEMREILSEVLPFVRMDHVIPANNDVLNQAIRRGLVSIPPSHIIATQDNNYTYTYNNNAVDAWIHQSSGLFVTPRLFMPYFEEVKVMVEEHLADGLDILKTKRMRHHYMPDIADTFYISDNSSAYHHHHFTYQPPTNVDISPSCSILTPDTSTMNAMIKREQKLRSAPSCQRALYLSHSSVSDIYKQIRLRVVREFNLPDSVAQLLQNASWAVCSCSGSNSVDCVDINNDNDNDSILLPKNINNINNNSYSQHSNISTKRCKNKSKKMLSLPAIIAEGNAYITEIDSSCSSEGTLSDAMPDVAAIAGNMLSNQLCISSNSVTSVSSSSNRNHNNNHLSGRLQLDLGDGSIPPYQRHTHHHNNRTTSRPFL